MKRIVSFILVLCLLLSLCAFVGEGGDADAADAAVPSPEVTVTPTPEVSPEVSPEAPDVSDEGLVEPTDAPDASDPADEPENEDDFDAAAAYAYVLTLETEEEVEAYFATLTEEQIEALNAYIAEISVPQIGYSPNETVNFTDVGPLLPAKVTAATPKLRTFARRAATKSTGNGVNFTKSAVYNGETGKTTITMEAYVTGEKTTISQNVPCDIVLVLDQSGSMSNVFKTVITDNYEYTPTPVPRIYTLIGWLGYMFSGETYYYRPNGTGDTYYVITPKFALVDLGGVKWTYTDENGETHTLTTAQAREHSYIRSGTTSETTITRKDALQQAAKAFTAAVAEDALTNNVDHTISVVGFASGDRYQGEDQHYENTEVFVGGTEHGYGSDASAHYSDAIQHMNTSNGVDNVNASIDQLAASGGTLMNLGMEMANGILEKTTASTADAPRKKVVVIFTDGNPGWSGFETDTANSTIAQTYAAKSTYNATVYTIGIYDGAYPNETDNANRFMNYASSNYPDAQSMTNYGNPIAEQKYFLSTDNQEHLTEIFTKISQEVGGANQTTLTSATTVQDTVSDYFTLPESTEEANVHFYTATYTGDGSNYDENAWELPTAAENVTASIEGQTIQVTGFNYSENWCGTENGTSRGQKLIISFDVDVRNGFLGGNGVPTNKGDLNGIYAPDAKTPLSTDVSPTVNIPVATPTVTAYDKNTYFTGSVTEDQLKEGNSVKFFAGTENEVTLESLKAWQKEFVTISTVANSESSLSGLQSDISYTFSCTINGGEGNTKAASATATVNVFKPVVTFKDSQVYYGDTMPTNFDANKVSEVWKHGDTLSTAVNMLGTVPTINYSYATGKQVMPNEDVPVTVTAKIGNQSITPTYEWQKCSESETKADTAQFIVHPLTCSLTITKSAESLFDENDSFIFTVKGKTGTNQYCEAVDLKVVINGTGEAKIVGLPVGTYTVTESDGPTGWSWRYTASGEGDVTLGNTSATDKGTITITNTLTINKWLSGSSYAVNTWQGDSVVRKVIATVASILRGE